MKQPTNNHKELIGEVTLSTGEKIKVYMPTIGDILDGGKEGKEAYELIIEASIENMSYKQFKNLSFPDGVALLEKLNGAFTVFTTYIESMNSKRLN